MCLVANKTSFVCVEPLHLSQWCWLGRRRSQEVPAWCLRWSSALFVDPQRSCEGADEATRPADPTALSVWASPPWDGRSIAWIHRSQSAAALITLPLFFYSSVWVMLVCSFLFSFLDAQSSDALQTHFYRSLPFVPASVVLWSLCFSWFCMSKEETTLFLLLFWFSIRVALHLSCRHAALPQREGEILLFYWHSLHLLTNTLTYFMKLYFLPQNNVHVHFFYICI